MDFHVQHESVADGDLVIRQTLLSGPKLIFRNRPVPREKGCYTVPGRNGRPVTVRIPSPFFFLVPKIEINGQPFLVAQPLKWYEYTWTLLPLVLIVPGGAIGGALGAAAAVINLAVSRGRQPAIVKFSITTAVTAAAVGFWTAAAVLIRGSIR